MREILCITSGTSGLSIFLRAYLTFGAGAYREGDTIKDARRRAVDDEGSSSSTTMRVRAFGPMEKKLRFFRVHETLFP